MSGQQRGASMSKLPEVGNKPQSKKKEVEEFTVTFAEFEATECAVFTAEMSLVETYFCDIIAQIFSGGKGGEAKCE